MAIEAVLSSLKPDPYGWGQELPAPYRFFGQPLALKIETRPFPADDLASPPTQAELELVRRVLAELPEVLAKSEHEYRAYNADFPELLGKVHEPRV
jgi:hypothetical protein